MSILLFLCLYYISIISGLLLLIMLPIIALLCGQYVAFIAGVYICYPLLWTITCT